MPTPWIAEALDEFEDLERCGTLRREAVLDENFAFEDRIEALAHCSGTFRNREGRSPLRSTPCPCNCTALGRAPCKDRQRAPGHALAQQTLDSYSHMLPSLQQGAVAAVAQLFATPVVTQTAHRTTPMKT